MESTRLSRRFFLGSAACAAAIGARLDVSAAVPVTRPNVIFITADQQSSHIISCTGNPWLKTPAMDYIAQNVIRFERAYTSNPVCAPARFSWMTGRFPGYFDTP